MRRNKFKIVLGILITACVILCVCAVVIVLGKKSIDEYKKTIAAYEEEISSNTRTVYVASRDIVKGETINDTNVMQQQIYSGLDSGSYISAEAMGCTAIVDIGMYQPVMSNMVVPFEVANDERIYELVVAHLMTTQKDLDIVDVRIMFPNGEDYLVLPKKKVMDLQLGTSVFSTYLNEDEILRIASATVDAYTTTGAKIYTTKYKESNLQDEPVPTYLVKPAVIDLINSDPNIIERAEATLNLEARNDLDARLGALSEDHLKAVAAGLNLEDTAKNSVLREGMYDKEGDQTGETDYGKDEYTENAEGTETGTSATTDTYSGSGTSTVYYEPSDTTETTYTDDFSEAGTEEITSDDGITVQVD